MGKPTLVVDSGMTTRDGHILGCWLGTSSLWMLMLSPYMAVVGLRCARLSKVGWVAPDDVSNHAHVPHMPMLMQPVLLVYVDNTANSFKALCAALPLLGQGFMDGDNGVRGDLFHLVCLLKTSGTLNHPSWLAAQDALLPIFKVEHDGDKQAALAAQAVVEPLPTVRYPGPPSHTMLPALQQWATHWLQNGIDTACGISAIENMANNNQGAQTCPPERNGYPRTCWHRLQRAWRRGQSLHQQMRRVHSLHQVLSAHSGC